MNPANRPPAPGPAPGPAPARPAPGPAPAPAASAPPGLGSSQAIKIPFRTLYDTQYVPIKKCLCSGITKLFSEIAVKCTQDTHLALREATFVDVIDETKPSVNTKKVHPNIEATMDGQIASIMQFILTNPSPQIKQDIRRNFSDMCGTGTGTAPVPPPPPPRNQNVNMPGLPRAMGAPPVSGAPKPPPRLVTGGSPVPKVGPTPKRNRMTRKKITK